MNLIEKVLAVALTGVLYVVHLGINWGVYRFDWKKTLDDLRRFGTEFAFIGVSFFATALLDTSSGFYERFKSIPDDRSVALATVFSILVFCIFDGLAVWFYKTYLEKLRGRQTKRPVWRLLLSHTLGIVAMSVGILLM